MSIDRIHGAGRLANVLPSSAVDPSTNDVAVASKQVQETSASEPFQRLEAGEINLEQYLDLRIEEATSHLKAYVPEEHLTQIKNTLRNQLENDPALIDLVQHIAGKAKTEDHG